MNVNESLVQYAGHKFSTVLLFCLLGPFTTFCMYSVHYYDYLDMFCAVDLVNTQW